jgi:RimJ/RimL family protein N-acetyltransferase
MQPHDRELKDSRVLHIREATPQDTRIVLEYLEDVSGESDFLGFGPGEFGLSEAEEQEFLRQSRDAANRIYLLGLIDGDLAGTLSFVAEGRPRIRHRGELGMSVRRRYWGLGVGGWMLDALIDWARAGGILKKINLRVRTDNHSAIRLYERRGFEIEGTIRRDVFVRGEFFHHYWMGLEL